MKPVRTAIYGACHASALERVLRSDPALAARLEFVPVPPCMTISDQESDALAAEMAGIDVFIYQPISKDYRGPKAASAHFLERAGPQTRMVSFSYYHFEAYTPYLTLASPLFPPSDTEYTDYLLAAAIADGLDDRAVVERLKHFEGFEPYAPGLLEAALDQLRSREGRVLEWDRPMDVRIADRAEAAFRSVRLGHTINHPTPPVFQWLAEDVTRRIGEMVGLDLVSSPRQTDPLDGLRFPVAPFVREAFDMTFEDGDTLTWREREVPLAEYVAHQRPYYEAIPRQTLTAALEKMAASRPWYAPLLQVQGGFGAVPARSRIREGVIRCDEGAKPAVLAGGWAEPEAAWVWSNGPAAVIEIEAPDTRGDDLTVRLTGMGYVPPGAEAQAITVFLGRKVLAEWRVRPNFWRNYSLTVPARLLRWRRRLRLTLAIPGCACPDDLLPPAERGGDPRRLGVAVRTLSLFRAPPAASGPWTRLQARLWSASRRATRTRPKEEA